MKAALAIESSNTRGMGHLFRSFQYVDYLESAGIEYVYLINDDAVARSMLDYKGITYQVVDYEDTDSDWEKNIIEKEKITIWFNDKYTTTIEMAKHIKDVGIPFVCIDDIGEGAECADMYFAGMIYPTLKKGLGRKNYCGNEYIVLSKELDNYKRIRTNNNHKKIAITMGGSDPHEVTEAVVKELLELEKKTKNEDQISDHELSYDVSIVIGPSYKKREELERINNGKIEIYQNLDSLFAFLYDHDLVITGGGGTCCEAAAMGLPALIIANASHEINTGRYMQEMGVAVYLGDHSNWDREQLRKIVRSDNIGVGLDAEQMSRRGMELFDTNATDRIWTTILKEYR